MFDYFIEGLLESIDAGNVIWKDVLQYDGRYQVSTEGEVREVLPDGSYQPVKQFKRSDKFMYVRLKHSGSAVTSTSKTNLEEVGKLVAGAFLVNPKNKPKVGRIDFDRTNNCVTNLIYETESENIQRCHDAGKVSHQKCKIKCLETGEVYKSIKDTRGALNLGRQAVQRNIDTNQEILDNGGTYEDLKSVKGYTLIRYGSTKPKKQKPLFPVGG